MLYIYSKGYINSLNKEFVVDVEKRFSYIYSDILKMKNFNKIIKEIDDAEYLGDGTLKGKFGICGLNDISTGCKAVLLSCYYGESKIVNFVECGDNAFNCAQNLDVECHVYLDRPFSFSGLTDFVYYDGEKVDSLTLRKRLSNDRK